MTIVEGNAGVIVIDTLATPGAARVALDLYFAHRPRKPVVAVIYTHSHGDHFGGISGVVSPADVAAGRTTVIAPSGFMDALVEEQAFAANLTARRGEFQFGAPLPIGEKGTVDYGEGKAVVVVPSGAGSIIPPTETVRTESRTIDGVRVVFQLALNRRRGETRTCLPHRNRVVLFAPTAGKYLQSVRRCCMRCRLQTCSTTSERVSTGREPERRGRS